MNTRNIAIALTVCAATAAAEAADVPDAPPARLAIVADKVLVLYGQAGYCGSMDTYEQPNSEGVLIPAAKRTWVRLRSNSCVGDFSFVPQPGNRYVIRTFTCAVGLFVIHRDRAPTREALTAEEKRLCLLPWNHGVAEEPAAPPVKP